jgi:hypothetical protein
MFSLGGDSKSEFVYLNDRRVEVRKNLWQALWCLRATNFCVPNLATDYTFTKKSTRWIWIDALCIDQSNTTERNHQVLSMGRIYKTALEVFAWLGCRSNLPFGSRVHTAMLELAALAEYDDPLVWKERVLRFGTHNFVELFTQPYWQRMWILQEIRLASKITLIFDTLTANWTGLERLGAALDWTNQIGSTTSVFDRKKTHVQHGKIIVSQAFRLAFHRIEAASNTLEELLYTGQHSVCADPRDKVYAVLGLATDCQNGELEIDYWKSLFEVYSDVINFYHASWRGPNQSERLLRLSEMLQASFDRPLELNDGAEALLSTSKSLNRNSTFQVRGYKTGTIVKLHSPLHACTLLDALSRRARHLRFSRDAISKQLMEVSKAIPIDDRFSLVSRECKDHRSLT